MKALFKIFKPSHSKTKRGNCTVHPDCENNEKKVELGRLVGYGNFSFVCIGFIQSEDSSSCEPVAVKIPREDIAAHIDMENELFVMRKLGSHDLVLGLIGTIESSKIRNCSFRGTFLLTNLCANGSLKDYLKRVASSCDGTCECAEGLNVPAVLLDETTRRLESAKFSFQIASGMEYIASKGICHRDLSARNVLLDERKNCKISDFGLSNWLSKKEIGESSPVGLQAIPWRWLSPECFEGAGYSTKSDVWSFGVTMWEIYSMGELPYPHMKWGPGFKNGINDGSIRLDMPTLADGEIYTLMSSCWQVDPQSRPKFTILSDILSFKYSTTLDAVGPRKEAVIEAAQPTQIPTFKMWPVLSERGVLSGNEYGMEIPLKDFQFETNWMDVYYGSHAFAIASVYGRKVYVKAMLDHHSSSSNRLMERMNKELKIHRELGQHPHVVELMGAFTTEVSKGLFYIASLHCEKRSLFDQFRKKDMLGNAVPSEKKFARFAAEIASALWYINGKNIVHNGKGIQSVLLDSTDTCKLRDFSESQYLDDSGVTRLPLGENPLRRWMAPETLNNLHVTGRTDVWKFGITLWEMYDLGTEVPLAGTPMSREALEITKKRPSHASNAVYAKILECCNSVEDLRPNFADLHTFFRNETNADYYLQLYT